MLVIEPVALQPLLLETLQLIASALSFFTLLGIGLLQAGFCRAKNVLSVLLAQFSNLTLCTLAYGLLGFGLMYGASSGWIGRSEFLAQVPSTAASGCAFLLFQTLVCATAGAIAQGGLVERSRLVGHLAASLLVAALIYPVLGAWAWGGRWHGGGWLEEGPNGLLAHWGLPAYIDIGGSSVVHCVGGWVALAASLCLGPRAGKYDTAGNELPLLGHSMVLVWLGASCIWLGSFGMQIGLSLAALGPHLQLGQLGLATLNTQLASAAGAAAALLTSWRINGKPDIGVCISGALAGLVAIGAGVQLVSVQGALALGFVAGVLVVTAILWVERRGIDDPVGAISVHAVAGAWGSLAVGLFHRDGPSLRLLGAQALGVVVCFVWSFGAAVLAFRTARSWGWLRVQRQAEAPGLDLWEHDAEAYPLDCYSTDPEAPGYDAPALSVAGPNER